MATSTSTPRASDASCGRAFAPPYTHATRMPVSQASRSASSAICIASSRVGATTRHGGTAGVSLGPGGGARDRTGSPSRCRRMACATIGTMKAAVLPEPVCALASKSRSPAPLSASGSACRCTGVGAA